MSLFGYRPQLRPRRAAVDLCAQRGACASTISRFEMPQNTSTGEKRSCISSASFYIPDARLPAHSATAQHSYLTTSNLASSPLPPALFSHPPLVSGSLSNAGQVAVKPFSKTPSTQRPNLPSPPPTER